MKTTIPDELKAAVPQTKWGRILTATPVVMTVVATLLAGLASSEMTRAQYDRSLAAQQQSKAGDQWSYFQAKRLRSAMQHSTLDVLEATTPVRPFDAAQFRKGVAELSPPPGEPEAAKAQTKLLALLDSRPGQQALAALEKGALPGVPPGKSPDRRVSAALEAVENAKPEPEIAALVAPIKVGALDEALRAANSRAQAFDTALRPFNQTIDELEQLVSQATASASLRDTGAPGGGLSLDRDFTVARLRYQGLRYDTESRLNQAIANVYELQVRKSNLTAERHHKRSQRFFYGMLAAQAAVIISTFSLAAQKRSLLWTLAAAAGLAAVAFAIYVYFYI